MITNPVRESALRRVSITANELNQLLFWAKVGTEKTNGGSYYPTVLETIKEYRKICSTKRGGEVKKIKFWKEALDG